MRALALVASLLACIDLACADNGTNPRAKVDEEDGPKDPHRSDFLYADDAFPAFKLTVPQDSLDALAVAPREYAPATLQIDDDDAFDVEIHVKGEDNFEPLPGKAALKVKVKGGKYKGLDHFTLNNLLEDDSLIAERLAYAAFRETGIPAPRANNGRVSINGDDYGVYANVETEDEELLARWFDDNTGNLYEEGGADFTVGDERSFDKETNADADDYSDLEALSAAIAGAGNETFMDDIEGVVDVDAFLKFAATEAIVEQWDGYGFTLFGPNNFRVYFDPSNGGRASILPWGLDMSFKPYDGHDLDMRDARGLLLQKCLASPACSDRYDDVLAEQTAAVRALDLAGRAQTFHDQLGEGDISVVLDTLNRRLAD